MNWRIKGLAQKVLSVVPGGGAVNDLLQHTLGDLRDFDRHINAKVTADWLVFAAHLQELGVSPEGLRFMEIGTGWFPTLPLCFSLAGAASCVTFDLTRHLDAKRTLRMRDILESHLPAIATASRLPLDEVQRNFAALKSATTVDELLRVARIEYHAPADATATGLPDANVDVVFSNSVFEHVPVTIILRMLHESRRVLRPGGLAIHSANCGDHYAYFDRKITAINYLTIAERNWNFWVNDLLYQNRLRPQDFLSLAKQAGLEIVLSKYKPRPELLAALPHLTIAPEFRQYPPEQLCSTSVDFAARKR